VFLLLNLVTLLHLLSELFVQLAHRGTECFRALGQLVQFLDQDVCKVRGVQRLQICVVVHKAMWFEAHLGAQCVKIPHNG